MVTETLPCISHVLNDDVLWFDFENIAIPESALPTSFVSSGSNFGTVNRMAIVDDWMYVVGRSLVSVFGIADNNLQLINRVGLGWNMETVFPFDDHLFIGSQNSMTVANISDPVNPFWQGEFLHATP